jgi:hypothetical protein
MLSIGFHRTYIVIIVIIVIASSSGLLSSGLLPTDALLLWLLSLLPLVSTLPHLDYSSSKTYIISTATLALSLLALLDSLLRPPSTQVVHLRVPLEVLIGDLALNDGLLELLLELLWELVESVHELPKVGSIWLIIALKKVVTQVLEDEAGGAAPFGDVLARCLIEVDRWMGGLVVMEE